MTEYIGKHSIFKFKRPFSGPCFHGESWYKCPWCGEAFEGHDVHFGKGFTKIKEDYSYGYYQHKCGKVVACEWLRKPKKENNDD